MSRERFVIAGILLFAALYVFWLAFVHYTPVGRLGLQRNVFSGVVEPDTPGLHVTAPWVQVAKVDVRPIRVCITSASRAFNCRLVQFQPNYFRQFVDTEGFRYYWWSNRFSFNWGYDEEYRGFRDIMRGYAFSAKQYPFVLVTNEYD